MIRQRVFTYLVLSAFSFGVVSTIAVAAPSAAQKTAATKIKNQIDQAGRNYLSGKYDEAASVLSEVQTDLEKLAGEADAELIRLLTPQYDRLRKAHELLEFEGIKLPALRPLGEGRPATPDTPVPTTTGVSFTTAVAPILVSRCGKCHIAKSSGKLSIATYEALMKGHPEAGVIIFKGDAVGSRLIEVIVDGEMPPNGKIPSAELELLKKWINEGARFDGDSEQTNLTSLAPGAAMPEEMVKVEIQPATGNETVSFSRHVAPVLIQNCSGCHVSPDQQARAGLNMTTFAGLLQGGDGGAAIMAGNGAQSLLIQKLKGTAGGQRMPLNRGPLPPNTIARIEKWIDEGAKFDGDDPNKTLADIAAYARAEGSTHEQLAADRMEQADNFFQAALPGINANTFETENFFLVGNVGESTLAAFGKAAEAVVPRVAEAFQAPTDKPLIKGRLTLYFFKIRYDYSEFGNMVERRKLPSEWSGHWRFSGVDAYAAMIAPRTEEEVETLVAQQVTGAYVASLGKTSPPRWFSEGAGRVIASRINPDDPRVVKWNQEIPNVIGKMTAPDDCITGKLPPEASDVGSYSFVQFLMADSQKFNRLITALKNEQPFAEAFSTIYGGSPNQVTVLWIRKVARRR